MATKFNKGLTVRPFGAALLSIAELRAWLAHDRQELETDPPLAESGFIQIEVLLCDIERAALGEYTPEAAQVIVDIRPAIASRELIDEAPTWAIAAELHLFWRKRLSAAFERGELRMLDAVTKQPIELEADAAPDVLPRRNKLTKEQQREIVQREKEGVTHQALANAFGVSRQRIDAICKSAKLAPVSPFPGVATKLR
ncbi:hypothetical protein Q3A80_02250 [Burkholderia sp. SR8]|uniref:hypothetical protein n=1 Tax=Burkholderia sp. SR8 TaxID=3062277 RepID=UPI004064B0EA